MVSDSCFSFFKFSVGFGTTIGDLWDICGLSVAVLGRSQVDCGLRDHFATTVAYLLPSCITTVPSLFIIILFNRGVLGVMIAYIQQN